MLSDMWYFSEVFLNILFSYIVNGSFIWYSFWFLFIYVVKIW